MYVDVRNNNKVSVERALNSSTYIVKNLKDGKRYLVDKKDLKELIPQTHGE